MKKIIMMLGLLAILLLSGCGNYAITTDYCNERNPDNSQYCDCIGARSDDNLGMIIGKDYEYCEKYYNPNEVDLLEENNCSENTVKPAEVWASIWSHGFRSVDDKDVFLTSSVIIDGDTTCIFYQNEDKVSLSASTSNTHGVLYLYTNALKAKNGDQFSLKCKNFDNILSTDVSITPVEEVLS